MDNTGIVELVQTSLTTLELLHSLFVVTCFKACGVADRYHKFAIEEITNSVHGQSEINFTIHSRSRFLQASTSVLNLMQHRPIGKEVKFLMLAD